MILSIHVPKAGGNSFRQLLETEFGPRFMKDYGDWAGFRVPEAIERVRIRTEKMRGRRDELRGKYDIIHGHFAPEKYLGLFPKEEFVAFFRDPYQQSISHYWFLVRNPQRDHLEEKMLHEAKMTIYDYLRWEAFHDHQTQYLGGLSIQDLSMVGLAEEFYRSVDLFNATFGCNLHGEAFLNSNPDHEGAPYKVDAEVRKLVNRYRARDVENYRRAKEIFARRTLKAAV